MVIDSHKLLNKEQQKAVKHTKGASIILAGAGSGKTRVLVNKVVNLINRHKVKPSQIVMITFTNKAAGEMKLRISREFLKTQSEPVGFVGTFHAFCARILRHAGPYIGIDRSFTIFDDDDQTSLVKTIIKKLDNPKKYTPGHFLYRISAAKNQLVTPDKYLELFSDYGAAQVATVYKLYQKELQKNQALDFDDLIMQAALMFTKYPKILLQYQEKYQYLLVDEFQDTNYAQYVLTRLLGAKYKNVTVVGDFSQSIYSWRGADIRNLERFKEDFPETKVFELEQNYRSTGNILNFAYDIISKNQTHPILQLMTNNSTGDEVMVNECDNETDEALYVASEIQNLQRVDPDYSITVLYRTNAQSRVIEEAFLHLGIGYILIGGTRFYERKEIKDILAYLRLIINPNEELAAIRLKKNGKRKWQLFVDFYKKERDGLINRDTADIMEKIFEKTGYLDQYNPDNPEDYSRLENIRELKSVAVRFSNLVEFLEQVALVESEYSQEEKKRKNDEGVKLMTLHQAKGLEFDHVFIVGVEEGLLPHSRSVSDLFELEEERRLFYVGITRAKIKLYITHAKRRFIFGRRGETVKSRFLGEDDSQW